MIIPFFPCISSGICWYLPKNNNKKSINGINNNKNEVKKKKKKETERKGVGMGWGGEDTS